MHANVFRASVKPVRIARFKAGAAPATVFESNRHLKHELQPLRSKRGKAMSTSASALTREPGDRPDARSSRDDQYSVAVGDERTRSSRARFSSSARSSITIQPCGRAWKRDNMNLIRSNQLAMATAIALATSSAYSADVVDPVVVTAARLSEPLGDVIGSVSVITRADIQRRQVQSQQIL